MAGTVTEMGGGRLTAAEQIEHLRTLLSDPSTKPVLQRHVDIASSTAIELAESVPEVRAAYPGAVAAHDAMERAVSYAQAVADYAAWLAGGPATQNLVLALDLTSHE